MSARPNFFKTQIVYIIFKNLNKLLNTILTILFRNCKDKK